MNNHTIFVKTAYTATFELFFFANQFMYKCFEIQLYNVNNHAIFSKTAFLRHLRLYFTNQFMQFIQLFRI